MGEPVSAFLLALDDVCHHASSSGPDADVIHSAVEITSSSLTQSVTDSEPRKEDTSPILKTSTSTAIHQSVLSAKRSPLDWLYETLPDELAEQVLELLSHPSPNEDLAESLLNLVGYDRIDKISEIISRRQAIVQAIKLTTKNSVNQDPPENAHEFQSPSHALVEGDTKYHGSSLHRPGRGFVPQAQVIFQTSADVAAVKKARKDFQSSAFISKSVISDTCVDEWELTRNEQLSNGPGPLFSGRRPRVEHAAQYPNVYLARGANAANLSLGGQKMAMPVGTMRDDRGDYEEITIPAPAAVPFRFDEELLPITAMDAWGKRTFHEYKTLNRLQSIVFPLAYHTNENMLVCAPTGAGKTDVALLSILRCLSGLCKTPLSHIAAPTLPPAASYKIIYVAPLKALAAEVTAKFEKRLRWAGVKVKELTGDMKLTKKEVEETTILVTTPEKWDVVTRKGAGSGDGEVADVRFFHNNKKVKLLIIDEVHLLHEDRGAVIESIVARTLRLVESSQSLIRIVGLSATLPNYLDVAEFLRVNPYQGLFYFDASFRPVPLEQHFLGVKGKAGSIASRANLDNATFDKVAELLKAGHQVMVFVHARKDTVKTAQTLNEKARADGLVDLLDPRDNEKWSLFKRDLSVSRNREMKELAALGFGIHHAGMLRSDRNISERMFEANVTKVLCCTATLAWGVNLPAYAVVIKGTQIYDSGKGCFVDLSILDVLQIFGRAGRPQYESQGVGYICTTSDKLDHYISAITQQHPIESKFTEGLVDSLNAEISLGTVANVDEGVRWLGYSYLFVRMRKNPLLYGMVAQDVAQDPLLGSKRHTLIANSAKRLKENHMIEHDSGSGTLVSTDLGRIASKYYIRHASIEIFNRLFRPRMSEADVLALIASSVEFEQVQIRENEVTELTLLLETVCPCEVKSGTNSSTGKVNILLQAYISKAYIDDFALVSDSNYVSQNAGRIVRALLEIAMAKGWAPVSLVLMSMSKAIEKRMWPFDHPLGQFGLAPDLMYNIERWADDLPIKDVASMSDADFGALIHQNERLGSFAAAAARQLPQITMTHSLQPITHDLLQIRLAISKSFDWSEKQHGTSEAFWVWIEDADGTNILQRQRINIRVSTTTLICTFTVGVPTLPKELHARVVSDRWLGVESLLSLSLDELKMPSVPPLTLPLLELPLLTSRMVFSQQYKLQGLYHDAIGVFDPIQTQSFHTIAHTSNNALIIAPSAESCSVLTELAAWREFSRNPKACVIFLTPRQSTARQLFARLRNMFHDVSVVLIHKKLKKIALGDQRRCIFVASPSLLHQIIFDSGYFRQIDLIVAPGLHSLDADLEMLLSRLRMLYPASRIVGSSSPLYDSRSLSMWLGIPEHACCSFAPSARSTALNISFQSFNTPQSAALLKSMVRPAYATMRLNTGSTICFVPSRSQCQSTANELVTQTASDMNQTFLNSFMGNVDELSRSVTDSDLYEALLQGIAVYHEGLPLDTQKLALELFASGTTRVLIAPRESCWTLPLRASMVIILGAQFLASGNQDEREIRDYSTSELIQMQSFAVPRQSDGSAEFVVMCQKEQAELYGRFLLQGLPLESQLSESSTILSVILTDLSKKRLLVRQDLVDLLSWTFLGQRVLENADYYVTEDSIGRDRPKRAISCIVDKVITTLERRCCVLAMGESELLCSEVGKLVIELEVGVDFIERLQRLELEELLRLTKQDHGLQTSESQQDSISENVHHIDEKLRAFLSRLPRSIRDLIGEQETQGADYYCRRVLLAAFAAGRVPRDDEELRSRQALLVKLLLSKGRYRSM